MAVKHLTYLDLTPAQRRKGASDARQRVTAMLSNPFLPPEQKAYFETTLQTLSLWEAGELPKPKEG